MISQQGLLHSSFQADIYCRLLLCSKKRNLARMRNLPVSARGHARDESDAAARAL
jgi:hypothetical protein